MDEPSGRIALFTPIQITTRQLLANYSPMIFTKTRLRRLPSNSP
jgi:hypothetical protein